MPRPKFLIAPKPKEPLLHIVGKTTDNQLVVANVWRLITTQGLSLTEIVPLLKEKGYICSWIHLYLESQQEGYPFNRLLAILEEVIIDTYDKEFWLIVKEKLFEFRRTTQK